MPTAPETAPETATASQTTRRRVPAVERRDELIEAAVHEFAHGGLHGTPVDRIARRVGVAQPYVFSLFGSKRELFLAAVDRATGKVIATFERTAAEFDPATAEPDVDLLHAMGQAYVALLAADRDALMLQHQAYAACDDELIRERVRAGYARLISEVQRISGADAERIDEFIRYGMSLNVAAAMGVEDLSSDCDWVRAELASAEGEG
jgi:AcrR family transcriptional regulator